MNMNIIRITIMNTTNHTISYNKKDKSVDLIKDGKLVAKDPLACNLCMSCVERVGSDRGLSVRGDETNFIFKFETDGSLTARQALDKAVEILSREADEFAEGIEALAQ